MKRFSVLLQNNLRAVLVTQSIHAIDRLGLNNTAIMKILHRCIINLSTKKRKLKKTEVEKNATSTPRV